MVSSTQKLEQGRAAFAYNEVKKHVDNNGISNNLLRSYIKKMPSMIQVNGLGQTIAFYYSKTASSGDGLVYKVIYETLQGWLRDKYPHFFTEHKELVEVVINVNSPEYRILTTETMAILNWMRKFADGMIQGLGDNN